MLMAFSLTQIFLTAAGFNIPGVFLLPPGFLKKSGRNSNKGDQEIFFQVCLVEECDGIQISLCSRCAFGLFEAKFR
jgi:hypothetical protein